MGGGRKKIKGVKKIGTPLMTIVLYIFRWHGHPERIGAELRSKAELCNGLSG